jgi:hypothetical protein
MVDFYIDPSTQLSQVQRAIEQNELLISNDANEILDFTSNNVSIQVLQPTSEDANEDNWQDYSIYEADCERWKVVVNNKDKYLELNITSFTIGSCLQEFSNNAGILFIQPKSN